MVSIIISIKYMRTRFLRFQIPSVNEFYIRFVFQHGYIDTRRLYRAAAAAAMNISKQKHTRGVKAKTNIIPIPSLAESAAHKKCVPRQKKSRRNACRLTRQFRISVSPLLNVFRYIYYSTSGSSPRTTVYPKERGDFKFHSAR